MGGQVTIGVRLSHEDKIITRELYTSNINFMFENVRFFNEDIFHIQEIMLSGHGDPVGLYPESYGIVFGDFQTKKIHSLQDYTSIGKFGLSGLSLSMSGSIWTGDGDLLPHVRFQDILKKYDVHFEEWTGEGYVEREKIEDFEHATRYIHRASTLFGEFVYTVPEWEFIKYEFSERGVRELLQALKDDGISISAEDEARWEGFIRGYFDDEEEDDDE